MAVHFSDGKGVDLGMAKGLDLIGLFGMLCSDLVVQTSRAFDEPRYQELST